MKTHWKKLTNPNYLGAYSLGDSSEMNVIIEKVVREMVTGSGGKKDECTVAHLKDCKPMILNSTNCRTIASIYNSSFIEDWANKKITLYVAKIKAFGEENIEALRVKPIKPELPELKPSDKTNWNNVKKALLNGFTFDQVKTKWKISVINSNKLKDEIQN